MIRIIENNIDLRDKDNILKLKLEEAAENVNTYLSVIDDVFKIFIKMIDLVSKEDSENELKDLIFPDVKLHNSDFSKNMIKNMLPENPTNEDYQKAIDKCNEIIDKIKQYWKNLDNLNV
jgi:hypothetical protein